MSLREEDLRCVKMRERAGSNVTRGFLLIVRERAVSHVTRGGPPCVIIRERAGSHVARRAPCERAGSCYARRASDPPLARSHAKEPAHVTRGGSPCATIRERAGSFERLKSGLTVITSASAVPLFLVDPDEEYRLRFCVKTPHSPS